MLYYGAVIELLLDINSGPRYARSVQVKWIIYLFHATSEINKIRPCS